MLRFLITNLLAFLVALFFSLLALGVSRIGHATPSPADIELSRSTTAQALQEVNKDRHDPQAVRAVQDESNRALERLDATMKGMREGGQSTFPSISDELLEKTRRDVSDLLSRIRDNPDMLNDTLAWQSRKNPPLLIMISFSMPAESIEGLFREAARSGAKVVLRGMVDNSMQATANRLMVLLGVDPQASEQQARKQVAAVSQPAFAIDPTLFQRFNVDKVPTFVVPLSAPDRCSDKACPTPPYVKVAGDVSLAYALRTIKARVTDNGLRQRLRSWLEMLEDKP